jgi:hypothetical protein
MEMTFMRLRKALASGALLAAAAMPFAANAAISVNNPTTGATGELWITVWDPNSQQSYQQDLGINTTLTGFGSSISNIDLGTGFSNFIGAASSQSALRYAVFGTNGVSTAGNGVWSTSTTSGLTSSSAFSDDLSIVANWRSSLVAAGEALNAGSTDFVANVSSIATPSGLNAAGYFGDPFNAGTLGGTATFTTNGGLGDALSFYFLGSQRVGTVTSRLATLFGTWSLSGNFLSFTAGGAPIPLPAGIWLLGSALLGLVGIARRQRATVAA